jgi:hypothetical protein
VLQQLSLFEAPPPPPSPPGRVLAVHGALAAEAALLARLDALLAEARREPSRLALPVRVVVPSRSLRAHVAAALVRARGRSAAGIVVQTLFGLAAEVLERSGEPAPRGLPLFDLFAQRLARDEPALRRGLGELVDGYAAVAGAVRDLLDAGFQAEHAEAAEEALAAESAGSGRSGTGLSGASRAEIERARALVRVAARSELLLDALGLGHRAALLRRAALLVEADPERALPARAVLVHGFADATGTATDLLEALLKGRGAWLLLDRPPVPAVSAREPGAPSEPSYETAFAERLLGRLGHVAAVEQAAGASAGRPPGRWDAFHAAGAEAEAREIARRARALLDRGARPEAVGIVARDLAAYALPLRRHLGRLGVPFSGAGARGSLGPAGRRVRALLDVLRRGAEAPAHRWLEANAPDGGPLPPGGRRVDLRLAFATLGAGRLRDVAELPLEEALGGRGSLPLPLRHGLRISEGEEAGGEGGGEARAERRRVPASALRRAVAAAARLREALAAWPEAAPAAEHLERLARLLAELGWRRTEEGRGNWAEPAFAALDALSRGLPPDLRLERDEVRLLLARALQEAGTSPLGGRGGGVQVLTVMEARGLTFEHLFVAGLNRDVFPRPVREDPLLPDDLRRALQGVLPDVPAKRSGFDEERYLFAQLLSASPEVTLSWQSRDADGRALSLSPLVERLSDRLEPAAAPSLSEPPGLEAGPAEAAPRPADEHAVLAALHAPRSWFARVLPLALDEVRREELPSPVYDLPAAALAAARVAALEELDPDLRTPEGRAARAGLGPFFGFLGAADRPGDPRRADLFVTRLERLAACPWQVFVARLLRVEPTPDPLDALPGLDPLLLGNTVHRALEGIVRAALPQLPEEANLAASPVPVPWPAPDAVDRLLRASASAALAEEGIALPGLARALADRARPFLETARELDWGAVPVQALGAEVSSSVTVTDAAGRPRAIRFTADRVDLSDLHGEAAPRWTDYKTGKPFSDHKREDKRRERFLDRVRRGRALQGVAYRLAGGGRAHGRYLFLAPGLDEGARELLVSPGDAELETAFADAARAALTAWDAGAFFPRVVDPAGREEPNLCRFCEVAEACLRGDSGARGRLAEWARRAHEAEEAGPAHPAEAALLAVWDLEDPS